MSAFATLVYGDKLTSLRFVLKNLDGTAFDTTGYSNPSLELAAPGAAALAGTVAGSFGTWVENGVTYKTADFLDYTSAVSQPASAGQVDVYRALVKLAAAGLPMWLGAGPEREPFTLRVRRWP
jgi:hypothetical protein